MASSSNMDYDKNVNAGNIQFTLNQFCKMAAISYKRHFFNPALQPLFWNFMNDMALQMSQRMWRHNKIYKQEDILSKMQTLMRIELENKNGN